MKKILIFSANPRDTVRLRLDEEIGSVHENGFERLLTRVLPGHFSRPKTSGRLGEILTSYTGHRFRKVG